MKNLLEYINEKLNIEEVSVINESEEKWFRLQLNDFEGAVESLKSILSDKDIYNELIDGGIKIKIKENQVESLSAVIEFLTELVTNNSEDEKLKDAVEKLSESIVEMTKYKDEKAAAAEATNDDKPQEKEDDKSDEE